MYLEAPRGLERRDPAIGIANEMTHFENNLFPFLLKLNSVGAAHCLDNCFNRVHCIACFAFKEVTSTRPGLARAIALECVYLLRLTPLSLVLCPGAPHACAVPLWIPQASPA